MQRRELPGPVILGRAFDSTGRMRLAGGAGDGVSGGGGDESVAAK